MGPFKKDLNNETRTMEVVFFPFLDRRLLLAALAAPDPRSPSNNIRISIVKKKKCTTYKQLRFIVMEQYRTVLRILIILPDPGHHWIGKARKSIYNFSIDRKTVKFHIFMISRY
jgi:hypothetical protein